MKCKVSKKDVLRNYTKDYIITLGYCDLEEVLSYFNPFAYSSGVYGWSCDYYEFKGYCISTGYAPIDGLRVTYEFKEFLRAEFKVKTKHLCKYEDKRKVAEKILSMLIEEARKRRCNYNGVVTDY